MATRLVDGSIQMADGRVLYANSVILAADLLEVLPLVMPPPAWPFVSGGGGGGGGAGTPGARGANGAPGANGAQGPQGPGIGNTGPQGSQGPQGQGSGSPGAQGAQGPQGIAGTIGVNGAQGNQGFQGAGTSILSSATGTTTNAPVTLFTDTSPKVVMGTGTVKNTGANGLTVQETVTDAFGTTTTISTNVPAGFTYPLDPQTDIGTAHPPYVSYSVAILDQVAGNHTTYDVRFGAILGT